MRKPGRWDGGKDNERKDGVMYDKLLLHQDASSVLGPHVVFSLLPSDTSIPPPEPPRPHPLSSPLPFWSPPCLPLATLAEKGSLSALKCAVARISLSLSLSLFAAAAEPKEKEKKLSKKEREERRQAQALHLHRRPVPRPGVHLPHLLGHPGHSGHESRVAPPHHGPPRPPGVSL